MKKVSQRTSVMILLLVLVGLGYGWYRLRSTPPTLLTPQERLEAIQQGEVEYTNFLFDYSVILPDAWPIEDISQPLAAFLSPSQTLESGDEQSLYEKGAVSIQIVGAQLGSRDAFLQFVHDSLEPGLRERNVEFSGTKERIAGYDGYRISVTKPYTLTQLIINGPLVTRLVFQHAPKALDRMIETFDRMIVPSEDGQAVMQLTDTFMRDAKAGASKDIYAQTSASFRSKLSQQELAAQLKAGKDRFALQPIIVSMLMTNETITTRSVLVDKAGGTMNRVNLIFVKEEGAFKIDGVSISTEQENTLKNVELSSSVVQ